MLSGVLDYRCGKLLRDEGYRLIIDNSASQLSLDCSAVSQSSSVGVALLLAFLRDARKAGKTLEIIGLPKEFSEIANVMGVLELLPLQQAS